MDNPNCPINILVVEDDADDRLMITEAFAESKLANNLYFAEDGKILMDFLKHSGNFTTQNAPRPELIMLDLNLSNNDGRETLAEIKADPELRAIPVVVLTTSKAEEDVLRSYDLGVSGFVIKPVSFERLVEIVKKLSDYWFKIVQLPDETKVA